MGTRRRHRKKKNALLIGIIVLALLFLAGMCGFFLYMESSGAPKDPGNEEAVSVVIPQGTATGEIASILEEKALIKSEMAFKLHSKTKGYDGKYKAGEYSLSSGMSMDELMEVILTGKANTIRFTIPEGYDIKRITEKLGKDGLINETNFALEIETGDFSYDFLDDAPAGSNRLEGYLFPETYDIYTTASEHDVINKMLSQFDRVFTDEYKARAKELDMSIAQVIALASVIEREAVVPEDRPVISGVFYNRIKADMPLQSCATIQYILGEQKQRLSTKDTQIDSPYNTYINKGLPIGPICSPGKASIEAALYPKDSDYLYFLAKGDGSHVFSRTYKEHLANKAKYID